MRFDEKHVFNNIFWKFLDFSCVDFYIEVSHFASKKKEMVKTTHDKFLVIIHFWKTEINKRLLILVNLKLCLIFLKFFGRIIPGRIWETTTTAKTGKLRKKYLVVSGGKTTLNVSSFFLNFYLQILSQILPEE